MLLVGNREKNTKTTKAVPTTDNVQAQRIYNEEKTRMRSAKTAFTKKLKKLEASIQDFLELKSGPDLPEGGLVCTSTEIGESM